ncbi:hypothetical protein F4780DRAFT_359204 [Xylariomycetidae sp. FL0641]|nr:hypothetical protein F4780DRAFT_359204 [Xylariomycetidae sp. FL0641]
MPSKSPFGDCLSCCLPALGLTMKLGHSRPPSALSIPLLIELLFPFITLLGSHRTVPPQTALRHPRQLISEHRISACSGISITNRHASCLLSSPRRAAHIREEERCQLKPSTRPNSPQAVPPAQSVSATRFSIIVVSCPVKGDPILCPNLPMYFGCTKYFRYRAPGSVVMQEEARTPHRCSLREHRPLNIPAATQQSSVKQTGFGDIARYWRAPVPGIRLPPDFGDQAASLPVDLSGTSPVLKEQCVCIPFFTGP